MTEAKQQDRTPTLPSVKPPPRVENVVAVLATAYGLVALAALAGRAKQKERANEQI